MTGVRRAARWGLARHIASRVRSRKALLTKIVAKVLTKIIDRPTHRHARIPQVV